MRVKFNYFSLQRSVRATGQTARNNYREESTDDDLVPKRHHRQRHLVARSGENNDPEQPGVSRSGRKRRPNPRLLD